MNGPPGRGQVPGPMPGVNAKRGDMWADLPVKVIPSAVEPEVKRPSHGNDTPAGGLKHLFVSLIFKYGWLILHATIPLDWCGFP